MIFFLKGGDLYLTLNCVSYNEDIQNQILSYLDGWRIQEDDTETIDTDGSINPFVTADEFKHKANKIITKAQCRLFYEETLDNAFMHTNRLNIDDLTSVESRIFIRAVCKWTASNLWNKYNIRVNNEDLEDTYVQSYGGLLYSSAMKALQPFINQRITGMSSFINNNDDDDLWV